MHLGRRWQIELAAMGAANPMWSNGSSAGANGRAPATLLCHILAQGGHVCGRSRGGRWGQSCSDGHQVRQGGGWQYISSLHTAQVCFCPYYFCARELRPSQLTR